MLIDASTYIGNWPFRPLAMHTLNELCDYEEKRGITHIVCSNLNAIFYMDARVGNEELYDAWNEYSGAVNVLPFAVLNPMYVNWQKDISDYAGMGFSGVEFVPQYHGNYSLASNEAKEAYALAGKLGLAVKVTAWFDDPRQRHYMDTQNIPSGIPEMLASNDGTTTLISGADAGGTLAEAIKKRLNVFIDIVANHPLTPAGKFLANYGAEHVVFASHSPLRYIEPQLAKLLCNSDIGEETKSRVMYGNLKAAFRL